MSHFAVIAESVPHTFHGGGGITVYSALRAMLAQGHKVSVIALGHSPYNGPKTEPDHIRHLEELGVPVLFGPPAPVPRRGRLREYFPGLRDIFPAAGQAADIKAMIDSLAPDGIFMYHWDPIAAALLVSDRPKLGLVGDPVHLPALFRRTVYARYEDEPGVKRRIRHAIQDRTRTRASLAAMRELLSSCGASGAFAAHHARMFSEMGVPNHGYYRTPTPDPLGPGAGFRQGGVFKIMHIGHLRGTATLAGVQVMAEEIIPRLESALPAGSFEIHLVGGYFETIPDGLKAKLAKPFVKVRGQISPADGEFLSSHVVLVPTPIELGIRVRIITAFSFGSCTVAHTANRAGIPELEHGGNCLLAGDGAGLADHCLEIYRDPARRRAIEAGSRATYDAHFSLDAAGKAIADRMQDLAGKAAVKA